MMIRHLIAALRPRDGQAQTPDAEARKARAAWGEALSGLGGLLQSIGAGLVRSAYEGAEAELAGGPDGDPDGGLEIRQVDEQLPDDPRGAHQAYWEGEDAGAAEPARLQEVAREAG